MKVSLKKCATTCMIPGMTIISGGQTGADRAALDAAIEFGIDYGGSIPKGRKAEDGIIAERYSRLTALSSPDYESRTEKNVVDSDGTLIFTIGRLTGGTAFTLRCAKRNQKPHCIVDFERLATHAPPGVLSRE